MVRLVLAVLVMGSTLSQLSGCSSKPVATPPEQREDVARQEALTEVKDLLQIRETDTNGKPATRVADLARYEKLYTAAYPKVRDGEFVVQFGAPLDPASPDKILVYEKRVPESGGYVLMQDGATVKKMTADEFKSAPMAKGSK